MNSKNKLVAGVATTVVVLGGIYVGVAMHYQHRYLPHTTVMGVNLGGKTQVDANTALKTRFDALTYKLKDGSKTVATSDGSKLGIRRSFTHTLNQLAQQQSQWAWLGHALGMSGANAKVDPVIDQQRLTAYSKNLADTLNKRRTASHDANMYFNDKGLKVDKAVFGNQIDATKLSTTIVKDIRNDDNTIQIKRTYIKPAVTTKSTSFIKAKTRLKKLATVKGKVTVEDHAEDVTKADLYHWLGYEHGHVTISQSGVEDFTKAMDAKYSTHDKTREFHSTKRGVVKVSGGTYGWSIQTTATANDIIKDIKAGKDFTVKAITSGSGYHADGTDIGNTYVEVDVQNQHEYYYKDGKLALDSDIVTGKPSAGDSTPLGVQFVWNKQQDATLRGRGDTGSDYATKVKYWMPIDYTGVGLHDAPWQPKFGGDWYLSHGSNGCVNNPPDFMVKLYAAVALGTPVIVF